MDLEAAKDVQARIVSCRQLVALGLFTKSMSPMVIEGYKNIFRADKYKFLDSFFTEDRIRQVTGLDESDLESDEYDLDQILLEKMYEGRQEEVILGGMAIILFEERDQWFSKQKALLDTLPELIERSYKISIKERKKFYSNPPIDDSFLLMTKEKYFKNISLLSADQRTALLLVGIHNSIELGCLYEMGKVTEEEVINYVLSINITAIDELLGQ